MLRRTLKFKNYTRQDFPIIPDVPLFYPKTPQNMTSNKTNGSLNLYPMNSDNYTAANAGVSNSDTDKRTLLDSVNGSHDNSGNNDTITNNNEEDNATAKSNCRTHGLMKSCVSEEDMIPPYDYTSCTNNSLLNDTSVTLASDNNSLDLEPQKKHKEIKNLNDEDNAPALTTVESQSTNNTIQTSESTDTQYTQETGEINETVQNINTLEETRQLSANSSSLSTELIDNNQRKDTIVDNTPIEKPLSDLNINSERNDQHQEREREQQQQQQQKLQQQQQQPRQQQQEPQEPQELEEKNELIQTQPQQSTIQTPQQQPQQRQQDKGSIIDPKSEMFNSTLNNSDHLQRQAFEQRLEQKKMDQFRRLNQLPEKKSKTFAKSMSPMSPKSTTPFSKLPPNVPRQQSSTPSSTKTTFNNPEYYFPKQQHQLQNDTIPTKSLISPVGLSKTASGMSSLNNNTSNKNKSTNPNSDVSKPINNGNNNPQPAFSPPKRNASPFRDPTNLYLKQINDQQRPLYTPAVLRVMKNTPSQSSVNESGFDVYSSPSERPMLSKSTSTTSIRSTSSSIMDYWNYIIGRENSQAIEGPTRKHWKPDSSKFNCTQCGKLFNYITERRRKHHCRSCGEIFCGDCLKNYIYLDEDAKFTLFGSNWEEEDDNNGNNNMHLIDQDLSNEARSDSKNSRKKSFILNNKKYLCKVCLKCFQQYEEFVLDHTTRDHNLGANGKDIRKRNNTDHKDQMTDGQNIPVDWDWSSF